MAQTKLSNLVNPQVMGEYLDAKLVDAIKLSPLMTVDRTLEGQAGDSITVPTYGYIGDADELTEGEAMTTASLTATTEKVTIKQVGKAVEITDKAVLCGYGDAIGESADQILTAIASKIEKDAFTALEGITAPMEHTHTGAVEAGVIADAMVKFGEDLDEEIFAFINPKHYATIRKDANFVAGTPSNIVIGGTVGEVYGAKVVVSNRVAENRIFLVKKDALGLVLKRNAMVETDRDILAKSTVVSGDELYACYLKNKARAVKVTISE